MFWKSFSWPENIRFPIFCDLQIGFILFTWCSSPDSYDILNLADVANDTYRYINLMQNFKIEMSEQIEM